MKQLHMFAPAEKQIKREERKAEAQQQIKWAEPATLAEMIEGRKGMAERSMNTEIWPEHPELYQGEPTKWIVLRDFEDVGAQMAGKRKAKPLIRLGPFHTRTVEWLPLADRRKVLDVMIKNPWFSCCWEDERLDKPRRKLDPATLEIVRKRRVMKRVIKRFGMFADEMIRQEYKENKMAWGAQDDKLWTEEKAKAANPQRKVTARAKRKARSTDNDEFEATKTTA